MAEIRGEMARDRPATGGINNETINLNGEYQNIDTRRISLNQYRSRCNR
jgi:hypothetical protein